MSRNMQNNLTLKSFFMGGFECADHINRSGVRINLQKETLHHIKVFEDYKALKNIGINVVREGVCWSSVEVAPYKFDFTEVKSFLKAASCLDIQIIWDLCHFGYPDGLFPTHPQFIDRFVAFCEQFTIFYYENSQQALWLVPFNEISFLSWHSGDMRGTVPFAVNSGWDIKYHLCRAAILGIKAIRAILTDTVILAIEPLVKVHPAYDNVELTEVAKINNFQFQAMDIIMGRECPELGGNESLLDMLGFNYYYNNQWKQNNEILPWPDLNGSLTPLSELLLTAQKRYNLPILLAETGHFGSLRVLWLKEVVTECLKAINLGVDLRGMCIYPVIDRPDWDDLTSFSNCGLWDMDCNGNRIAFVPYIQELLKGQILFKKTFSSN